MPDRVALNGSEINEIARVRKVTLAGLALNLFLFGFKIWAGLAGGSKAVLADGMHTLSDLATDLAILFGVKWWTSPPDRCHPYGHKRIEALITLFVGSVLMVTGIWLAVDGVLGLRLPDTEPPRIIAFWAALFSIVLKETMYRATIVASRKVKSEALLANAWHHRSDALSSIPVAAAVAIAVFYPQFAFIDHVGELVVAIIIVRTSYKILKSALLELSDGAVSPEAGAKVESIVRGVDGVIDIHAIRSRRLGSGVYVDLHVLVNGKASVREGHDIAENVKHKLIEDGPDVFDVVVHIEPYEKRK